MRVCECRIAKPIRGDRRTVQRRENSSHRRPRDALTAGPARSFLAARTHQHRLTSVPRSDARALHHLTRIQGLVAASRTGGLRLRSSEPNEQEGRHVQSNDRRRDGRSGTL
jgi:hypothetical protein